MTSANKKVGHYDFRVSYQYPMSNGTPMEITSNVETKGEGKETKGMEERERKVEVHKKALIPPHLCERKTSVQRQKYYFPEGFEKSDQKGPGNTDTM